MGVLNITPDSFSDGGLNDNPSKAYSRFCDILLAGADIIDIGAQSTRPGALELSSENELKRLLPSLKLIRERSKDSIISIDTFYSKVAEEALSLGVNWINDVTGGRRDPDILKVIADFSCPYVINHSRGNSQNMNNLCNYNDLINDIIDELSALTDKALDAGIAKENIIWDPGIGFSKSTSQNINILNKLELFTKYEFPILVGPSRKRFIGEILGESDMKERIWGTAAVVCRCVEAKVSIVRVHDIEAISKTIKMAKLLWP